MKYRAYFEKYRTCFGWRTELCLLSALLIGISACSKKAVDPHSGKKGLAASYSIAGKTYHPRKAVNAYQEVGLATFTGPEFDGTKTASGAIFDAKARTAAHKTLPFGTFVRVTNLTNKESVVVKIIDRGPFVKGEGRVIDLSLGAANDIGMVGSGVVKVRIEQIPDF